MSKPQWLADRERKSQARFRMCINCKHVGDPCGQTNYISSEVGRATMYRCRLHPDIKLYFKTYACTDYEHGPTGAK